MKKALIAMCVLPLFVQAAGTSDKQVARLVSELGHAQYSARQNAHGKLIELGVRAGPFIEKALNSDDPEVRLHAKAIALEIGVGPINGDSLHNYEQVIALLGSVGQCPSTEMDELVALGRPAVPALLEVCAHRGGKTGFALRALGRIADPRSFTVMADMIHREKHGHTALDALASIQDHRPLGELLRIWEEKGDIKNGRIRQKLTEIARSDLGEEPGPWRKWYREEWAPAMKLLPTIKSRLSPAQAAKVAVRYGGPTGYRLLLPGISKSDLEAILPELHKFEDISLKKAQIDDLSLLKGLRLKALYFGRTRISDLSPLEGMPLEYIGFYNARVTDLSPLKGMKLKSLTLGGNRIADLRPLAGMPLEHIICNNSPVRDLTPLKGAPLRHVGLNGCTGVTSIEPLRDAKLESIQMFNTQVSDISPLKGMPLTDLLIQGTRVSDLAPLRGMQLRSFTATSSPIADLSPLEGAPLSNVSISKTKITNLAPLKDAPLVSIYFTPAAITNGIEHLRANRKLQRINGMSALAFWQKYDSVESKAKAEQSTESDGLKPAP